MVLGGAPKPEQAPSPASNSSAANQNVRRPAAAPPGPHGWTSASSSEFVLSKAGNDRKWVFQVPGLGDVGYLEKSGLRYLVLVTRGIYTEVTPAELGFDAQNRLNPVVIVSRMIPDFQSESVGPELVVNRLGTKFRFSRPNSAGGTDQPTTCAISLDQETKLPIRFEMDSPKSLIEARDLRLNIDLGQFDVPIGMKKVTSESVRLQIQAFTRAVQPFINALNVARPDQPPVEPAGSASAPAAGKESPSGVSSNRGTGAARPANSRRSPANSNRKPIRSI
jgi:hypothetical protein